MLKLIALLVIVIIAVIVVLALLKPDSFRVERSALIHAAPEKVFPYLNDLRSWKAWSAWDKKDPNMKVSHSGASSGVGAVYEWDGDRNVGKGRMEIIESASPSRVVVKLDFISPMEGHNKATFTLQPVNNGTQVIWVMDGPMVFISKVFSVFVSMDKMIGKDFEESLAALKRVVEK